MRGIPIGSKVTHMFNEYQYEVYHGIKLYSFKVNFFIALNLFNFDIDFNLIFLKY